MSKIEWTGKTWNPIKSLDTTTGKVGNYCEKVSQGCSKCYAERINHRGMSPSGNGLLYVIDNRKRSQIFIDEGILLQPLKRRKPTTYFVGSMTDVFGEWVPDEMLDRIFAVMALCPQHTFQVLTKRSKRMREYCSTGVGRIANQCGKMRRTDFPRSRGLGPNGVGPLPHGVPGSHWYPLANVWLGVSAEDRANLHRLNDLRETPAAVRFVSFEPLLEDLGSVNLAGLQWAIIGGESGPGARRCNFMWIDCLVRQCQEQEVAPFVKQLGAKPGRVSDFGQWWLPLKLTDRKGGDMDEWPEDLRVREYPQ